MNPDYHRRLTRRFLDAAQLPHEDRPAFLARLRGEDARLSADVASLLRHDEDERLPASLRDGIGARAELLPLAERIGPYRLVERIGEGGMGIVYRAVQSEPIEREVAIKLIRAGFETDQVLDRFASERRVLARMEHPNIARVLDAGTTSTGRPYVAMEYVRGASITSFADEHELGISQRLDLFLQVCDAVHYAHQNAIIHRDLKPSNVLVTWIDGRPVPKIIDFGIAKALRGDSGPDATPTEAGQLLGTPAYMSPEQASPGGANPDIRSDVYSLGVLLYELLTGCTPLDFSSAVGGGLDEIRRIILDVAPRRPSARVEGLAERASDLARSRATDPASLVKLLRGDLDSIARMALAKDRRDRYGSASELAADLRRSLRHEPIHARPPAALYRLGKLARRHRTASAVAAALVPVIGISAAVCVLQARRLARERDRAEEVSELLVRAYEVPFYVPRREGPRNAEDVLRRSVDRVERDLADRPVLQAQMLASIGEALRGVGESAEALPVLERARELLSRSLGAEDPRTLAAEHWLGRAYADRSRTEEAEALLVAVLEARRKTLGTEDLATLRTMSDLALLYRETWRDAEAIRLLEGAVVGLRRQLGETHTETVVNASLLAAVYLDVRRLDDAEAVLREYLPRMPADLPERAKAVYNLACVHALRGERAAALARLREAVASGFAIGFFADPNLGSLFEDPEFLAIYRDSHARFPQFRSYLLLCARQRVAQRRFADAEALYRYLLASPAEGDGVTRRTVEWEFAERLMTQGRYAEARPLIERRVAWLRAERASEPWASPEGWYLVQAHLGEGDVAAALAIIDDLLRDLEGRRNLGLPGLSLYIQARRAAIAGDRDSALRLLGEAVAAGFGDLEQLQKDLALRELRDSPEMRAILDLVKRREALPLLANAASSP